MENYPNWNGHNIIDAEHVHDLEARSAIHEFQSKLPRQEAEALAHKEYLQDQAMHAAAHHLIGMKAAKESGHDEAAAKHGERYKSALTAAGLDTVGPVPPEVIERMKGKVLYNFKKHPSDDIFHQPPADDDAEIDERIRNLLSSIAAAKKKLLEE